MRRFYKPSNNRNSIDDFPLVPEQQSNVRVELVYVPPEKRPPPSWESIAPSPLAAKTTESQEIVVAPAPSVPPSPPATELASPSRVQQRTSPPARKKSTRRKKPVRKARKIARPVPAKLETRDHHERHCTVCNSPDRDVIEEQFVHWHNPADIGSKYGVGYHSVYRHAHARGLFAVRERNLRFALGHMIERASNVQASADSILRAIRAYSCLNREGQWVELPTHIVVSSGPRIPAPPAVAFAAELSPAELPASSAQTLQLPANDDRVESDATR